MLARQFGTIRRDQALGSGMNPRHIDGRLRRGEWKRLYNGVYADTAAASTWKQSVLAAVFKGGDGTVASGPCAAALLKLAGFHPGMVEVSSPHRMRNVPFVVRSTTVPPEQRTTVGPIPCTSAARTLLDVAGVVTCRHLEDALDDALRRKLTSLPRLKLMLAGIDGRGRRGIAVLREAIRERDDGRPIPASVLESRLWRPLHRLGAPRPERQMPIVFENREYRIDYAFPSAMVAVEAQSYKWHTSRSAWEQDLEKANALQVLGWKPFYVKWNDLLDPKRETFHKLRRLLLPQLFNA